MLSINASIYYKIFIYSLKAFVYIAFYI